MQENTENTKKTREANLRLWQPGQSGNPSGRPKGSKNLATIIRELEADDFNWDLVPIKQKDAAKKIGSPWKAIVYVALAKAWSGDIQAMRWLQKAGYGDKLVVEADEGFFATQKIQIEIVTPTHNVDDTTEPTSAEDSAEPGPTDSQAAV